MSRDIKNLINLFFTIFLINTACNNTEEPNPNPPNVSMGPALIINDTIQGEPVVIYANESTETMVAFSRIVDEDTLLFTSSAINTGQSFADTNGNDWSIFGRGISPGNRNQQLKPLNYIYGYWFTFPAFYDTVEVYNDQMYLFPEASINNPDWLVSTNAIVSTGGFDFIPSIDNPTYIDGDELIRANPENNNYIDFNTLATVIQFEGNFYIYPHYILNYHEVVNDQIAGIPFTLSFCPLTQTSQVWDRSDMQGSDFGVSGFLYNSNLVLYDRQSESLWSQMLQKAISGDKAGEVIPHFSYAEMSIRNALQLDGNKFALSTNTGFNRNYQLDFYADYKSAEDAIFHSVLHTHNAFNTKEKVLGIVLNNDRVKVYGYDMSQ